MTGYIALGYSDLVLASGFLVLNAALTMTLRLGLAKQLMIAAARMIVQLSLIGLVLKAVFSVASPWLTLLLALMMAAFAGREVWARQERRLTGWWGHGVGGGAMVMAGTLVTVIALTTQIGADPWWQPRFALPLFGMILGNTMTGVSLGLDRLHGAIARERASIEARLMLGDPWRDAIRQVARQALRSGFIPIINAMAATGIVSLPGMMTGQILSGIDPTEAVKYQLLVMFLIAGATGLGVLASIQASLRRLTDDRHRLRLDRLGEGAES